jgi:hypothetical protein
VTVETEPRALDTTIEGTKEVMTVVKIRVNVAVVPSSVVVIVMRLVSVYELAAALIVTS